MIIDIHTHTFPAKIAERALNTLQGNCHTALFSDGTEAGLQKSEENAKIYDYPSKLYGIIESESVSISFRGKLFLFKSAYIKAHNEKSKSKEIQFYGYLGEQELF